MAAASTSVSLAQLRRVVLGAQGFSPRFRRASEDEVEATVRRLEGS